MIPCRERTAGAMPRLASGKFGPAVRARCVRACTAICRILGLRVRLPSRGSMAQPRNAITIIPLWVRTLNGRFPSDFSEITRARLAVIGTLQIPRELTRRCRTTARRREAGRPQILTRLGLVRARPIPWQPYSHRMPLSLRWSASCQCLLRLSAQARRKCSGRQSVTQRSAPGRVTAESCRGDADNR